MERGAPEVLAATETRTLRSPEPDDTSVWHQASAAAIIHLEAVDFTSSDCTSLSAKNSRPAGEAERTTEPPSEPAGSLLQAPAKPSRQSTSKKAKKRFMFLDE